MSMSQLSPVHLGSESSRYGLTAIALHWISALFIIIVGVLGLLHDSWPKRTQGFWINIHAVLGLLVWVLASARLWWRFRHPAPPLPNDVGQLSRRLSGPVHALLYVLVLVIPVLGIVTFIWHGRVFNFGLFQVDFGVRSNRAIFHPTEDIHGYLAYALFALVGVHVFAALWHHYVRHDGVTSRMWPAAGREATGRKGTGR
jgi:cytochrome b561